MRALTYIATISLTVATAVNVTAIIKAKAETKIATAWMVFVTSAHQNTAQHLITARYDAPEQSTAMGMCEAEAALYLAGIKKDQTLTLVREPTCSMRKPWSWVDR